MRRSFRKAGAQRRSFGAGCTVGFALAMTAACGPPLPAGSGARIGPATLGAPEVSALAVGCWQLSWELQDESAAADPVVPDSVQLRSSVMFGAEGRQITPATQPAGRMPDPTRPAEPEPWESRYRINRWWVEGTSVEMLFSTGEAEEWNVSLEFDGNDLSGTANGTSVADGPDPAAEVLATRIGCLS